MFSIFMAEGMDRFLQNIASFPTVFFTVFFVLSILFWLVAVLGLIDIDFIDIDMPDVDSDITNANVLAGLMLRFRLNGVPVTVVITFIAMIGWLICYYAVHFLLALVENNWLEIGIGLLILLVSLYLSVIITSFIIKPFRRFFNHTTAESSKYILGQVLIVRTSRVDENFGEATLEDGGAGLILKVRASSNTFKTGDRIVPIEYIKETNVYRVIAEDEFLGTSK
jgi:hypothetical protein